MDLVINKTPQVSVLSCIALIGIKKSSRHCIPWLIILFHYHYGLLFVSAGGIAAYNMGDGNVHSYENVDAKTTGGDYSNDVVARAKWYKNHGY